jgi:hypothetical protein
MSIYGLVCSRLERLDRLITQQRTVATYYIDKARKEQHQELIKRYHEKALRAKLRHDKLFEDYVKLHEKYVSQDHRLMTQPIHFN